MWTTQETVFVLWCRLTGADPLDFGDDEREAFLARPEVPVLAATPYAELLDAGIITARRGSLPLQHWVGAVRRGVRSAPPARTAARRRDRLAAPV